MFNDKMYGILRSDLTIMLYYVMLCYVILGLGLYYVIRKGSVRYSYSHQRARVNALQYSRLQMSTEGSV